MCGRAGFLRKVQRRRSRILTNSVTMAMLSKYSERLAACASKLRSNGDIRMNMAGGSDVPIRIARNVSASSSDCGGVRRRRATHRTARQATIDTSRNIEGQSGLSPFSTSITPRCSGSAGSAWRYSPSMDGGACPRSVSNAILPSNAAPTRGTAAGMAVIPASTAIAVASDAPLAAPPKPRKALRYEPSVMLRR
jgi:hypothetical protein